MVFGNMGDDCATGVAFTRDPSTGENSFYGEFLINAQGEDVVAGIRTPLPLTIKEREKSGSSAASLQEAMPDVFAQLDDVRYGLKRITAICRIWNSRFSRHAVYAADAQWQTHRRGGLADGC